MSPSRALHLKSNQLKAMSKVFGRNKIEQLARETKFVQRDSTLTGLDFLLLCVFAHQQCELISLEGMCEDLYRKGVAITKQSLHDRFNDHAVAFISRVLSECLSLKINCKAGFVHAHFRHIVIGDSTQVQLPEAFWAKYRGHGGGASAAGLKLQYRFDLLTHQPLVMLVQDAVQADHRQELYALQKNDLCIEDLGYFNLERFQQITESKAYFLSRLRLNVIVWQYSNGAYRELNLVNLSRKMRPGECKTMDVFIGCKEKIPVRLIIEKVPDALANEKRRKLKTDPHNKRKSLSRKRLILCNASIYITNTTQEQIPSHMIRAYYSLRWQVEIIFKAWKSVYRIDCTKPMKLQRFECLFLGSLILIVLTTNMMGICRRNLFARFGKELSEFKFFRLIKSLIELFKDAIRNPKTKLLDFLILIEKMALRTAIKQAKENKNTPFDILMAA